MASVACNPAGLRAQAQAETSFPREPAFGDSLRKSRTPYSRSRLRPQICFRPLFQQAPRL